MFVPAAEYERKQLWRKKFPAIVSALLSVFQLIFTVIIVGCEVGGDFVNFPQMNAFVGYWTCPIFMCAWISLAGASCCCRIRCCGITTLVFQCLAIPLALCVVGFDGYFLNYPTQCFFSSCTSYTYSYYYSSYYYYNSYGALSNSTLYSIKVPLIKGQLSAGVLMFVSCVVFIIIFAITNYRVQRANTIQNVPPVPMAVVPPPAQYVPPPPYGNSTYQNPVIETPAILPTAPPYRAPDQPPISSVVSQTPLICPNCRSRFRVSTERN